ncbi:CcmD family protein [Cyclobacterium xiamenense]|nr:CcmD family protein [Cyclobacterium xiamenense]
MKKYIVAMLLLASISLKAQDKIGITEEDYQNSSVQMADGMRSDGKIYVLVTIIGIVLGGILVYVIQTDRKISGLEKRFNK